MADNELEDEPAAMAPPAYEGLSLLDMLSRMQRGLYATLLERIEGGTAGKEDIKTLRQLLAENGMVMAADAIQRRMIDVTPKPIPLPKYEKDYNE